MEHPSDLQILTEINFKPINDWVLLTGSIADGWGNSSSDIDVIVITEKVSGAISRSSYCGALRRWVDIRCLAFSDVDKLKAQVEVNRTVPRTWGDHRIASIDQLDLYHRIAKARVLSAPLGRIASLGLTADSLARESAITHVIIARARWEDAAGALTDGDHQQAAFVAEIGIWHVVDALAALLGMTNPSSKWRLKKLSGIKTDGGWPASLARRILDQRKPWSESSDLVGWLGAGIELLTSRIMRSADCQPTIHERPERMEYDGVGLRKVYVGTGFEYVAPIHNRWGVAAP